MKDIRLSGFNYSALIYYIKDPQYCECEAEKCNGKVKGLNYLSFDEQRTDLIFYHFLKKHFNLIITYIFNLNDHFILEIK